MTDIVKSYLPEGIPVPGWDTDGLQKPFWTGLREEKVFVQRCSHCNTWIWAPEWICHACLSSDLPWQEVAPRGRIYSWNRIWYPAHPLLANSCPYVCVVVELEEADNIRMVGNLLGDPQQKVAIGARVKGVFEHHRKTESTDKPESPAAGGYGGKFVPGADDGLGYSLLQWQLDSKSA